MSQPYPTRLEVLKEENDQLRRLLVVSCNVIWENFGPTRELEEWWSKHKAAETERVEALRRRHDDE